MLYWCLACAGGPPEFPMASNCLEVPKLGYFSRGAKIWGSKKESSEASEVQLCSLPQLKGPKNCTCSKIGTFGHFAVSTVKYRLLGENIVQYNTAEGDIEWKNCGGQSMSVSSLSLAESCKNAMPKKNSLLWGLRTFTTIGPLTKKSPLQ